MARSDNIQKPIPLSGRLITSVDPSEIGLGNFQSLKNLRYTDKNPKGVKGMTKVNTSAITTYIKPRSGIHLKKVQPAESHVLVQAYNSGESASQVLQNTTAIGSQGNFSGTALHTDASGAAQGRFSNAPNGHIAYCNSVESLVWGGDEMRCGGFIVFDPDGSFLYDYSDIITNTLETAGNVATLNSVSVGNDSNSLLMLHMNGADTGTTFTDDSPTTPHTVTANGTAQTSTSVVKFGSASGLFDGNSDYLTVPDDADFDFSGGIFTIDCWIRPTAASDGVIYNQITDSNNYIWLKVLQAGAKYSLEFKIVSGGAAVVQLTTGNYSIDKWRHIALVENGDDYYLFVNGILKSYVSDVDRAANYTGSIFIGADATPAAFFTGTIDELRISNVARWTNNFEPPSEEYPDGNEGHFYFGFTRPVKGVNFYIGTANTTAGSGSISYWDGDTWVNTSISSDGTVSGGVTLAQDGLIAFTDTASLAKPKLIEQRMLYWYKVSFVNIDTTTTISHVTGDASFQSVKDIWDGVFRTPLDVQRWIDSSNDYRDFTTNVAEKDYVSGTDVTYAGIGGMGTSGYLLVGFAEPQMGLSVKIADKKNNTANALLILSYWDGAAWASFADAIDGTLNSTSQKSFNQTGVISWMELSPGTEFKTTVGEGIPLYYYKIAFDGALSGGSAGDIRIDYMGGIPAPVVIGNYKFPVMGQNRLWLCADMNENKNSVIQSAPNTTEVYNGDTTNEFFFGGEEELTAGAGFMAQFGSDIYDMMIFTKANETYTLIGTGPDSWVQYPPSISIGCIAPQTMKVVNIVGGGDTPNKQVVIWQAKDGIYMFDGRSPQKISRDIEDIFTNPDNAGTINSSKIKISRAAYDEALQEYIWLFASNASTTVDKEWHLDLQRFKWFEVPRGSGKELQTVIEVEDTNNNKFIYGTIDTGYMLQLEKGTNFDGTAIAQEMWTGGFYPHNDDFMEESTIHGLYFQMVAKATTAQNVAVNHYGDSKNTVSVPSPQTFDPTLSGYRTVTLKNTDSWGGMYGAHSFKFTISTDDETIGFEPLKMGIVYSHQTKKQGSY